MKPISFFLLIFVLLTPMAAGHAQNTATAIDSLVIDFWPDYDKAAVLVLLTGTLPDDTKLPATVTLPIPKTAQLNAVARIDSKDGQMIADISASRSPSGTLKFVTPDLRFRVEYYFPYTVNNNRRSFDYSWMADLPVNKLQVKVQQPLAASFLKTSPETGNVVKGGDGFDYHTYPLRAVPAGQPFSMQVEYKMTSDRLSAESLPQQNNSGQNPGIPDRSVAASGSNWPVVAIIAGGLIIIIALVWQIVSRRPLSGKPEPVHDLAAGQSRAKFCRNCGEAVDKGDKFCPECGRVL